MNVSGKQNKEKGKLIWKAANVYELKWNAPNVQNKK